MVVSHYEKWLYRLMMALFFYSVLCHFLLASNRGQNDVFIRRNLYFEIILVIPLLILSFRKYRQLFYKKTNGSIIFMMLYLFVFELLNTALFIGEWKYVSGDFLFWLLFLAFFYLAASRSCWETFLTYSFLVLLIVSLLSVRELLVGGFIYLRGQYNAESYLYDIQLGFAPIFLVLSYFLLTRQKVQTILFLMVFSIYVILQFYFQKRLPLFNIALCSLLLLYIYNNYFSGKKYINTIIGAIVVIFLIIKFIPEEYYSATINRFFEGGTLSQTAESDARYIIAGEVIRAVFSDPLHALFGYGLGGYILGSFEGKMVFHAGAYVDGVYAIEVGVVTFLLKYGLVFVVLFYGYIIKLLSRYRLYKNNPLSLSCWIYLTSFFVMTIMGEAVPDVGRPMSIFLLAASMGYLSTPMAKQPSERITINRTSF